MEQILKHSDPYAPIRKVPLDYNGIKSSAYSVQLEDYCKTGEDEGKPVYGNKWQEKGVVSGNYLLIPNEEVLEMGNIIAESSGITWDDNKTFFNGRQYMYSMTTTEIKGEVKVGDDVSLGFAMWNSYDGSRALSFELFLNRLVCMNGMVTKKYFDQVTEARKGADRIREQINNQAPVQPQVLPPLYEINPLVIAQKITDNLDDIKSGKVKLDDLLENDLLRLISRKRPEVPGSGKKRYEPRPTP